MMSNTEIHGARGQAQLLVEPIKTVGEVIEAYECVERSFGYQAADAFWIALNPGWDTPQGKASAVARCIESWNDIGKDDSGRPTTVYLKAVVPDPDPAKKGRGRIVGLAIWIRLSMVTGKGVVPHEDITTTVNLKTLYPDDEPSQRYLRQMNFTMQNHRMAHVKSKELDAVPCVMALDQCVVEPDFQRRGIATELVRWGIREAQERGDLDCITVGSSMGRWVYTALGFEQVGEELDYIVDDEFKDRDRPSNIAMVRKARRDEQA